MEKLEKQLNKEEKSVLAEEDFKEFIKVREIRPEDFYLIEELSGYPKNFFLELHNYFYFSREDTVRRLEIDIKRCKEGIERAQREETKLDLLKKAEIYSLFLEFAKKYHWTACVHLNSIFERRKSQN